MEEFAFIDTRGNAVWISEDRVYDGLRKGSFNLFGLSLSEILQLKKRKALEEGPTLGWEPSHWANLGSGLEKLVDAALGNRDHLNRQPVYESPAEEGRDREESGYLIERMEPGGPQWLVVRGPLICWSTHANPALRFARHQDGVDFLTLMGHHDQIRGHVLHVTEHIFE